MDAHFLWTICYFPSPRTVFSVMLKNYLVIAARSLRRHFFLSSANVVGLAVGMAVCMLIFLYIQDELSFDRMHDDAGRIVRVIEARTTAEGGEQHFTYTAGALGPELERSVPAVEQAVRMVSSWSSGRRVVQRGEARFYVGDHVFTEQGIFDMFDFEFVSGSPGGALDEPNEVVLTTESAKRYFGAEDPVGQILEVEGFADFTVTGVIDLPHNTHFEKSILFSFETLMQIEGWRNWLSGWGSTGVMTYLKLAPGTSLSSAQTAVGEAFVRHADDEMQASRAPYVQALQDIHLRSGHIDFDENRAAGSPAYLYLFGAIAFFVILIAAINYTNMATARSMQRAREIGMRKAVGAHRMQLVGQFLAESLLIAAVALILAAAIVWVTLPVFNEMAGKTLAPGIATAWPLIGGGIVIAAFVGLLAGMYPAVYISRYRPATVLRGLAGTAGGGAPLRKSLVVVQFTMSIVLIIGTLLIHNQLEYIQNKRLGFEQDQLVVVDINSGNVRSSFEAVKQEFAGVPGVANVAVSNNIPGDWKNIPQVDAVPAGQENASTVHFLGVDEDFLDTWKIDLLEGANFGRGFATDSTSLLVNETAARRLGVGVGDLISFPEDGDCANCPNAFEARVAGIVRDFHFESLHRPIGPLLLGYRTNPIDVIDYFTIRMDARSTSAVIAGLSAVGERFDPDHPFEHNFLDQRLAEFYTSEQQVRSIVGTAAMLAILIACLGLFGLAAFTAERRTKEIGIRKTLGATVGQIVALLTGDFARLVGIAFLIASPLAYLVMRWWMQDFAYHAPIGVATFLLAGGAALTLAVLTVSYQSVKAALADPVKSLRYE